MHRLFRVGAWVSGVLLLSAMSIPAQDKPKPARVYIGSAISETYHVDRIYKSMAGPSSEVGIHLMQTPERELLWIIGYEATIVDAKTRDQVSQEFMCHANLSLAEGELGVISSMATTRLFTLSQGQQKIRFPDRFGVPVLSNQRLILNTQILNLNQPEADLDLKHSVDLMIVRDKDLTQPMRPLFQRGVQIMKSLDEARYYGLKKDDADPEQHGASCALGVPASANSAMIEDPLGHEFTGHWVVEPGREVSRNNVTRWLDLEFDTRVHYIAVHLHPFAESLELYDLTEKKTVYRASTRNRKDGIGLDEVDVYSSEEGFRIYKDHEYEVVSTYNNTTDGPIDAMAVMFLYMLDEKSSLQPGS